MSLTFCILWLMRRYYISCWYAADRTTVPYTVIETGITVSQVGDAAVMATAQPMPEAMRLV